MARNPWKRLMQNVMMSVKHGSAGGRTSTNPKLSGRIAKPSQSTRRHEVSITWEDLKAQFEKQNGLCYWFHIPLNPHDVYIPFYPLALSVDRLDNEKGYEIGNFVISCRLANLGRGSCDTRVYEQVVEQITSPYANMKFYINQHRSFHEHRPFIRPSRTATSGSAG